MMIALPNQDKSFTVTLFMPTSKFDSITDGPSLTAFFEEFFPDSLDLIGRHEHFPANVLFFNKDKSFQSTVKVPGRVRFSMKMYTSQPITADLESKAEL